MMPDQLTTAEVAKLAGITPASVRTYLNRGTMPPPDGRFGPLLWWHRGTVEGWLVSRRRPGRPRRPQS